MNLSELELRERINVTIECTITNTFGYIISATASFEIKPPER